MPTEPVSPKPVARPWGPRRGGVFDGGPSRFGPRGAPFDLDLQLLHVREVEHYASFGNAVDAVTAATNGQLLPPLASERDDVRDIGGVCGSDDDSRAAVDSAGKDRARLVVPGVVGGDHPTLQIGAQPLNRDSGGGGWRRLHDQLLCYEFGLDGGQFRSFNI